MNENDNNKNCFDIFDDTSPRRKNSTIQILYDYEKHYMDLVKKYKEEIKFISDLLSEVRKEQILFYEEILPKITKKLKEDEGIDKEMEKVWLNRLTINIDRSFTLSETLINNYAIKKIDEFKNAVKEKLRDI